MSKRDLTLLGGLFATENITLEDATALADFCNHVAVQYKELPETLEAAIDIALDFFKEDPNTEAAKVEAAKNAAPCDHEHCAECGAPIEEDFLTELDFDMAVDLWVMVRDMVRARDGAPHGEPDERDEC